MVRLEHLEELREIMIRDRDLSIWIWACGTRLRSSWIKISGIPLPHNEAYPGERLEIQGKVPRLIGDIMSPGDLLPTQKDCLPINLASGLGKLGGLKKIECLKISNVQHELRKARRRKVDGRPPAQTDVHHGLEHESEDNKAVKRLKDNIKPISSSYCTEDL
ncbi:hypothetical protein BGZ82_005119 [Podila clonocystis]|nr:hypothetical protein BGZ82_005119 [Podila clonocystis]